MFRIDSDTNTMTITKKDTALFTLSLDNYQLGLGDKVIFTVANSVDLPKEDALITIEVTEFENGKATIIWNETDTDLDIKTYVYDVQINTKAGMVDTVIGPAKFKVIGGVTY